MFNKTFLKVFLTGLSCVSLISPIYSMAGVKKIKAVKEISVNTIQNKTIQSDETVPVIDTNPVELTEQFTETAEIKVIKPEETKNIYYTVVDPNDGVVKTLAKEYQDYIYQMCKEYGVSGYEKTIMAKLYIESNYKTDVIYKNKNGTTDYGIAQINSSNFSNLKKKLGVSDFLDPYQSIRCGVYMFSICLNNNNFNESSALVAYNTGKNGKTESKYSKKVLKVKDNMIIQKL